MFFSARFPGSSVKSCQPSAAANTPHQRPENRALYVRASGLVPDVFIAVFCTGLGCALALAGVLFWIAFIRFHEKNC